MTIYDPFGAVPRSSEPFTDTDKQADDGLKEFDAVQPKKIRSRL